MFYYMPWIDRHKRLKILAISGEWLKNFVFKNIERDMLKFAQLFIWIYWNGNFYTILTYLLENK